MLLKVKSEFDIDLKRYSKRNLLSIEALDGEKDDKWNAEIFHG